MFNRDLPFGQLAYFSVMWIVGFTFISLVNLKNRNGNPFKDSEGTYIDITKTFAFSILFFALSGIVVLRQRDDLASYCNS